MMLSYKLRQTNWQRALKFPGTPAATWTATDWGCAAAGEMGELCNLLKKRLRGVDQVTPAQLCEEIGGVIIYLDLLCAHLDLPMLDDIVQDEFNRVSIKRNLLERL